MDSCLASETMPFATAMVGSQLQQAGNRKVVALQKLLQARKLLSFEATRSCPSILDDSVFSLIFITYHFLISFLHALASGKSVISNLHTTAQSAALTFNNRSI